MPNSMRDVLLSLGNLKEPNELRELVEGNAAWCAYIVLLQEKNRAKYEAIMRAIRENDIERMSAALRPRVWDYLWGAEAIYGEKLFQTIFLRQYRQEKGLLDKEYNVAVGVRTSALSLRRYLYKQMIVNPVKHRVIMAAIESNDIPALKRALAKKRFPYIPFMKTLGTRLFESLEMDLKRIADGESLEAVLSTTNSKEEVQAEEEAAPSAAPVLRRYDPAFLKGLESRLKHGVPADDINTQTIASRQSASSAQNALNASDPQVPAPRLSVMGQKTQHVLHKIMKSVRDDQRYSTNGEIDDSDNLFKVTGRAELVKLYRNAYDTKQHDSGCYYDMFQAIDAAGHGDTIVLGAWTLGWHEQMGMNDGRKLSDRVLSAAVRGAHVVLLPWERDEGKHHEHLRALEKDLKDPAYQLASQNIVYLPVSRNKEKMTGGKQFLSHHMKYLCVNDTLFMGGLDMSHGRDDSAEHEFSATKQSWHDCHVQVKGQPAVDMMDTALAMASSYKNRDYKCGDKRRAKKFLLQGIRQAGKSVQRMPERDDGCMQTLLSLKKKYWKHPRIGRRWTLAEDTSRDILKKYCQAIEDAKHYVWFESQYIIGASKENPSDPNRIISSLIKRIQQAKESGDFFHFYCVLPFRPNGNFNDTNVQSYLFSQWATMEYLIEQVNRIDPGNAGKYLTFINPMHVQPKKDEKDRHHIYVHSKAMIVDGERALIGSANANNRSMAGDRDSECALDIRGVAYHLQIRTYQQDLLAEMLGDPVASHIKLSTADGLDVVEKMLDVGLTRLEQADTYPGGVAATSWGCIPKQQLMNGERPPHVPKVKPLIARLLDGSPLADARRGGHKLLR